MKKMLIWCFLCFMISSKVYAKTLSEYTLPEYTQKTIQATYNYVNIVVDGKTVNVTNFVSDGTTYLGLRNLGYTFGYDVEWIQEKRLVRMVNNNTKMPSIEPMGEKYTLTLNVLDNYANINVRNIDMYPRNLNYNGSLYISLRDAGAMFGYSVDYDSKTNTAYLNSLNIDYENLYFKADGYEVPKSLIQGLIDVTIANGFTVDSAIETVKDACITNIVLQKLTDEYGDAENLVKKGENDLFNKCFRDKSTYDNFAKKIYNNMPADIMVDFCKQLEYNSNQFMHLAESDFKKDKVIEKYGKIAYDNYKKNRIGDDKCIECIVYKRDGTSLDSALKNAFPASREDKYSQYIYKNEITAYTKKLYYSESLKSSKYVAEEILKQLLTMNEGELSQYIKIEKGKMFVGGENYDSVINIQRNIPDLEKLGLTKKVKYQTFNNWETDEYIIDVRKIHNEIPEEAFYNFYDAFEGAKSTLNIETNIDSIKH